MSAGDDAVLIRPAGLSDVDALVDLRREFAFEDPGVEPDDARPEYEAECRDFLTRAIAGRRWQIWIAELDGEIAAHVFVALIDRVPRPTRQRRRLAYLTNVYTRPAHRNRGIGARLIERAQESAREADAALMMVWPSDESTAFYARHGFGAIDEPLIWRA